MNENFDHIIYPEGATDKEKEWIKEYLVARAKEKEHLCVIYNPDCRCPLDQFVLLDRFPMSEKIHSNCPECKKWCLMEISDPIRFHLPILDKDYTLRDLKDMQVMEGPQKHLIEKYKRLSEREYFSDSNVIS